jgi:hypothetical protein
MTPARRAWIPVLLSMCAACGDTGFTPEDPYYLVITEIELVNVTDVQLLNDLLEVEVHLYEGNRFLGCAGQDSGLRDVEQSGMWYPVRAYFQRPPDGDAALTLAELSGRTLHVEVVEDDERPCPSPAVLQRPGRATGDDLIGISPPFTVGDPTRPQALRFDDVVLLVIDSTQRPY